MRLIPVVLTFLLASLASLAFWWGVNQPQPAGPDVPGELVRSMSFAPYRDGQSPLTKVYPTAAEIEQDIALLQGKVRSVRTYTSREGMELVPGFARRYGLKLTHSAWLGNENADPKGRDSNRAEIAGLIAAANQYPDVIERVIVGNEVLLRRDLTPQQLIGYIRSVKIAVKKPVSYADVWAFFLKHPEVARELDLLTIHILPYWEDEPVGIDQVGEHIVRIYRMMQQAFPGKPILIGEAGWPTAGRDRGPAHPSVVNAAKFLRTLVEIADRNGFDYNVVEAFDQPWKAHLEGAMGANWGMYDKMRALKYPLAGAVIEDPHWPGRWLLGVAVAAGLLALVASRLGALGAARLFGAALFAQVLGAMLVRYGVSAFEYTYTWVDQAVGVGLLALLVLLAARMLAAAVAMLAGDEPEAILVPTVGEAATGAAQRIHLGLIAVAVAWTVLLVFDGRYRAIPIDAFLIPALCPLALGLLRLWRGHERGSAFAFGGLYAGPRLIPRPERMRQARWLVGLLLAAAVGNLLGEGWAMAAGEDFVKMHPSLAEQAPLLLEAVLSNRAVLIWSAMLAAMTVPFAATIALGRRRPALGLGPA